MTEINFGSLAPSNLCFASLARKTLRQDVTCRQGSDLSAAGAPEAARFRRRDPGHGRCAASPRSMARRATGRRSRRCRGSRAHGYGRRPEPRRFGRPTEGREPEWPRGQELGQEGRLGNATFFARPFAGSETGPALRSHYNGEIMSCTASVPPPPGFASRPAPPAPAPAPPPPPCLRAGRAARAKCEPRSASP